MCCSVVETPLTKTFLQVCFLVSGTADWHGLQPLSAPKTLLSPDCFTNCGGANYPIILVRPCTREERLLPLCLAVQATCATHLCKITSCQWPRMRARPSQSEGSRGSIAGWQEQHLKMEVLKGACRCWSLQMLEGCWQNSSSNILSYWHVSDGSEHRALRDTFSNVYIIGHDILTLL